MTATPLSMLLTALCLIVSRAETKRVIMEPSVPAGATSLWDQQRRATGTINVQVVLRHEERQLSRLQSTLYDVSDPDSPSYGHHLPQKSIDELMTPDPDTLATVTRWLHTEGIAFPSSSGLRPTSDVLPLELDVTVAERLFNTTLHSYTLREQPDAPPIVRASAVYTLPAEVASVVLLVGNLHGFPAPFAPLASLEVAAATSDDHDSSVLSNWPSDCGKCDSGFLQKHVSPAVLNQRYGVPLNHTSAGHAGSIGVAEFQNVFYDQRDLDGYADSCGLPRFNVTLIGPNKPRSCDVPIIIKPDSCIEALLDIEVIKGVGAGLPLTDVSNKGYSILDWAQQLLAMPDGQIPLVQSVSYGNDEKQQASAEYMQAVNTALMKLGARGVSLLFASGDGGVIGRRGSSKRFAAGFPASSPYVTAVGGTDFVTKNVVGDEKAWGGSGGGFSYEFERPAYQEAAVAAYLSKNATAPQFPSASLYNAHGRGFPDVSALGGSGNKYCIVSKGKPASAYGTSAATPVVASVVAKLNVLRVAAGKPPLGFVNPLFYKHPEAFHDVQRGCNGGPIGVRADCTKHAYGFPALQGWDAATGLGTPAFDKLAALVVSV